MIKIKNLSFHDENKIILDGINITLTEKKIGIIGSNGSGKSTLLRLIKGLISPTDGTIEIDGINISNKTLSIKNKIGFMFQNPDSQIVFPIVEEDLAFGLKNLEMDKHEIKRKLDDIILKFDLTDLRHGQTFKLSGGEKQLLALAGILIMDPNYILFDEPSTFLDLRNKNKIFQIINNLNQTCILASHDLEFMHNFDRIIVMDKGKIIYDQKPFEAIKSYKKLMI